MKVLPFFFLMMTTHSFATGLTDLKIDSQWKLKFNPKEWSYIYLKPFRGISPNIFEHRKEKTRIILQRETHRDEIADYQNLVDKKCSEANKYYAKKTAGHAEVVNINHTKVCYIEFKKITGETAHQFVYPEKTTKDANYDLYSYAWNSNNKKSKMLVTNFLKEFVQ